MGKQGDFVIQDSETRLFKDAVRQEWNYGKYQIPVINGLPGWTGNVGEAVLYKPGSGGTTQYVWINTAWVSTWSITL